MLFYGAMVVSFHDASKSLIACCRGNAADVISVVPYVDNGDALVIERASSPSS